MSRWRWFLLQYMRKLWVRATLIGVLGIAGAGLAALADRIVPPHLVFEIGVDAIDSLLSIIASSMLAVTTFSLSVMTAAFWTASANITPRATRLLAEDRLTQNVLSVFVGSFLFSIVGLVVLKAGAYSAQGRVVLFTITVAVLAMIVMSLMRWIDHLTRFGRVGETLERLEEATRSAFEARLKEPCFGGRPLINTENGLPSDTMAVTSPETGYVTHFSMEELACAVADSGGKVYLAVMPGRFVYRDTVLAWVHFRTPPGADTDRSAVSAAVRDAFTLETYRSFDEDPGYGISVLGEIAQRALSPAVNDPGTAIDVIGRMARLLTLWAEGARSRPDDEIAYPDIYVPPLETAELFAGAFEAIARDGAKMIEVQLKLRETLRSLGRLGDESFRSAARHQAELALKRAGAALVLDEEMRRLEMIRIGD
ncbi:DUF2254 domain-containing protein [Paracoccus alkanivorans]|uniref:DUF2254 domain-containing protein n=1 Tax=Paracoccus alkanivorans TaxID=2116655 RepID=A0A3M0MI36_9RHOB|nr:DUF2254 domain-containing protein [Paracoccus alkanivorans]RMC37396.1 DUF2254 domain-containing protein [Paracoccus alkanivorans]